MSERRWRWLGRRAGPLLMIAGLGLIVGWAGTMATGAWIQARTEAQWERDASRFVTGAPELPPPPALARPLDNMDFRLRIPRLGYEAVVREGTSAGVLLGGPGHYAQTPWPGQPGNVGVAAHNVYWLALGSLAAGDMLVLDTRYGSFRYRMTGEQVVGPDDTSVLAAQPGRQLTLTTCWPLWQGQLATQRLAIYAEVDPATGR